MGGFLVRDDLTKFIGKIVRVHLSGGHEFEGKVELITDNYIAIGLARVALSCIEIICPITYAPVERSLSALGI